MGVPSYAGIESDSNARDAAPPAYSAIQTPPAAHSNPSTAYDNGSRYQIFEMGRVDWRADLESNVEAGRTNAAPCAGSTGQPTMQTRTRATAGSFVHESVLVNSSCPSSISTLIKVHNNALPHAHFHKDWQRRVKTWFDQPGRKKSRRVARSKKALATGAQPLQKLRPAVRCPTQRYNLRLREGRGFTISELKLAGIRKKEAKGLGISVDHRRRSKSEEGQKLNVARLTEYKTRLVVFPRKHGKPKSGDATGDDLTAHITRESLPLPASYSPEAPRAITEEEKGFNAFTALRTARADQRNAGSRKKRADAKAAEEAALKK
ncbi:large subunit ribosomal protein L13e, partial [Tremellales sp. Uapishka_1]